ncbi:MAG: hypothetical protein IJP12_02560 [Methanobrevibacter sp.]|nr:hypothetical protein [Methanobrevibacter sp.]
MNGGMKILFNDKNNPYPFDYSVKFVNLLLPEYVIEYLDKDLVYEASLPTVIVKPNQTESRNDYTYLVHLKEIFDKKLIIDFEHQSYSVDENRLVSMLWDLISFIFIYQINAILIIFTDEESYKKSVKSISLDGCINCTPFYFISGLKKLRKS